MLEDVAGFIWNVVEVKRFWFVGFGVGGTMDETLSLLETLNLRLVRQGL